MGRPAQTLLPPQPPPKCTTRAARQAPTPAYTQDCKGAGKHA